MNRRLFLVVRLALVVLAVVSGQAVAESVRFATFNPSMNGRVVRRRRDRRDQALTKWAGTVNNSHVRKQLEISGLCVCSMQVSTPAAPARGRARNNTRLRAFAESCTRCLSRAKRPSAQWCVSPGCKFGPDRNRRLDTGGVAQSATPYGRLKFSPRSRPSRLRKVTSEGGCSMGVCTVWEFLANSSHRDCRLDESRDHFWDSTVEFGHHRGNLPPCPHLPSRQGLCGTPPWLGPAAGS